MAVLASGRQYDLSKSPKLRLDPQCIVRAAVYIQAAVRRFLVEEPAGILHISLPTPAPPVAVAHFFARRLRHPLSGWDLEEEAMGVVAVICGRDRGLTLGPLAASHAEYSRRLPPGHPVLEMLVERFREVAVEAEDELLKRLQNVETPSQGFACIKEFSEEWGAPEKPLHGQKLFERAKTVISGLRPAMEEKLTKHLDHCQTMAGFNFLQAEVDRELGEGYPVLRTRVRNGRRAHREHVEHTAQSLWGWPPTGSAKPLARAFRWYAAELGAEHHVVDDFGAATQRILKKAEESARKELEPIAKTVAGIHAQLDKPIPPPKLVSDSLKADLQEQMVIALEALQRWQGEIGCESQLLFDCMRSILGDEALAQRCEAEAGTAAEVLRRPDPGPFGGAHGAAEAEERLAAAVRLCQLQAALGSLASTVFEALSAEFASELAQARPQVPLLRPGTPDDADDGWHRPPGWARAGRPPAAAPGPAARAAPGAAGGAPPELGGLPAAWAAGGAPRAEDDPLPISASRDEGEPAVSVRVRLHGVGVEDARCKSELLLMDRCANIIAEECGIPREWVSQVAFAEPPPKVALPAARLDLGAEDAELGGHDLGADAEAAAA